MAIKYNLKDKRVGGLKIIRLCTIDERPSKSHRNYWLCSLDHIIPASRSGKEELSNYQFLTVFGNLAKRGMIMEGWNIFKHKTNTKSDYFIESILKGGLE